MLEVEDIAHHVDVAVIKKLEVRRFGEGTKKRARGAKVPAGQSHSMLDEDDEVTSEESSSEEETDVEDEPEPIEHHEEECEKLPEEELEEDSDEELPEPRPQVDLGSHVVAEYEGQWFICEVSGDQAGVMRGYTRLSYMSIRGHNTFVWGQKDLHVTLDEDILLTHVVPEPLNSRGHVGLNKNDLKTVLHRMVMVFFLSYHRVKFTIFLA